MKNVIEAAGQLEVLDLILHKVTAHPHSNRDAVYFLTLNTKSFAYLNT
jgi:hypothetical protein